MNTSRDKNLENKNMIVFDSVSKDRIRAWDRPLEKTIPVLLETAGHPEDQTFSRVADEMAALSPHMAIKTQESDRILPAFVPAENIRFSAFPMQKELPPFLEVLSQIHIEPLCLPDTQQTLLEKVDAQAHLKLYIALQCPHCPGMVRTLAPFSLQNPNIRLDIIDGSLFPDFAQKDKIMAAPCLILDNEFRWTGNVAGEEVLSMITQRDPASLSSDTLKNILEQGDAGWITRQMISRGKVFDAFVALLLHDTWSVRLGAMVVVEELAQEAPALAGLLCPKLISVFPEKDVTVQGDILYALGEAGLPETKVWIEKQIPTLSHPDLKDAALEAAETLEERHG